jgi:hypothetical protein
MHTLVAENLKIEIEILDVETERLPSFQASLSITFLYNGGASSFKTRSVWFELDNWEIFTQSLLEDAPSSVADMSNYIRFEVRHSGLKTIVHLVLRKAITGLGEANLDFNFTDDGEMFTKFQVFANRIRKDYVARGSGLSL